MIKIENQKKILIASGITVSGALLSLLLTKTYPRGANVTLIYLVLFIISAISSGFLWVSYKNDFNNVLKRVALIANIFISVVILGFILLFIDTFIIPSFFVIIMVIGEFTAAVLYLIESFKLN